MDAMSDNRFKTVAIEQAVGMVLAHDITEVRPCEFKGRAFRKGHRIRRSDICRLQRLGKHHVYVLDIPTGYLHEDDAAVAMAEAFCGPGVVLEGEPREGKVNLVAAGDGLLKVEVEALAAVNRLGEVMCASRHTSSQVAAGDIVAGTRAIPLVVGKDVVGRAVTIALMRGGLFRVLPLRRAKAGLLITGTEIFSRLIEDRFEPTLRKKIVALGSTVEAVAFAPDSAVFIAAEIKRMIDSGVDLILTTAGMSVDPDDVTRQGILEAGGVAECYGAPVLPGAMFMIAKIKEVTVLGVPACGLYHERTILDLVLPRILAGETVSREEIASMGHGGLCLNCPQCRFPSCPFGKTV
jgi:molybdopterin biosynthesis enzyme